jgi:hypothetical protein
MDNELFNEFIRVANEDFNSDFTLMKFRSNWKACFGIAHGNFDIIYGMCTGDTADEAIKKALKNPISIRDVDIQAEIDKEFYSILRDINKSEMSEIEREYRDNMSKNK